MDTILIFMLSLEIIFNVLVALIFLAYWGVAFIILYHLVRFGIGVQPKKLAAIFLFGSIILSGTVLISFTTVDINQLIPQ